MRTEKGTEDLITGIIISEKDKPRPEREAAKEIIRTLKEENNLNIPPVSGQLPNNLIIYKQANKLDYGQFCKWINDKLGNLR